MSDTTSCKFILWFVSLCFFIGISIGVLITQGIGYGILTVLIGLILLSVCIPKAYDEED